VVPGELSSANVDTESGAKGYWEQKKGEEGSDGLRSRDRKSCWVQKEVGEGGNLQKNENKKLGASLI